jgi:hypothetical protein
METKKKFNGRRLRPFPKLLATRIEVGDEIRVITKVGCIDFGTPGWGIPSLEWGFFAVHSP